jgi:cytochrome P450
MTTTLSGQQPTKHNQLPTKPGSHFLLGDLHEFSNNRLTYMQTIADQYSPLVEVRFGPVKQFVITAPELAQQVLQSNSRNYMKEQFFMQFTRLALTSGDNLFTSDGDYWLKQRRIMQPMFHRKQIAHFGEVINRETSKLLDRWATTVNQDQPVDIADALMQLTMQIIGYTMLNVDIEHEQRALHEAYAFVSSDIVARSANPLALPLWVPTTNNRRFTSALATIHQALRQIIQRRQQQTAPQHDLLDMLIAARYEESGGQMSTPQLLDELFGIVSAGHETTSMALMWAFYLLAQHPEVEEKLHAEVDKVLAGCIPTVKDLTQLPYTRMVIQETLRLYPPAYVTTRQAVNADTMNGYPIRAGAKLIVNIYGLQRHRDYWTDPQRFAPERFAPENEAALTKFAYLPFGAGPRKCIGEPLAMMEAQLILAAITQRYRLELVQERPVQPEAAFVLRAKDGLWMRLRARGV